ncbi:MAG: hypothetical protein K0U37_09790 [Gammaproteobacteria bacterium]|nr:hypothetical protein [Gammaproteobacteria bacterium]
MVKYLILTSSGGGGHITVAKAKKAELLTQGVLESDITMIDIMGLERGADNNNDPWIPKYRLPGTKVELFSGKSNVNRWNESQKKGGLEGVRTLEKLIEYQSIAEQIQGPMLTKRLKDFLYAHPELEQVIDTQALSTADICGVISETNDTSKKNPIKITKIISEFITEKAVHYFKPLSQVTKHQAKHLTVQTVNRALTTWGETEAEFYERNHVGHIHFERITKKPLRPEFFEENDGHLYVQTHADDAIKGSLKEQAFMAHALGHPTLIDDDSTQHFKLKRQPGDNITTLTLGSQSSVAVLDYIDAFIEQVLAADIPADQRTLLFITTSKNDGSFDTMYAKARLHLEKRMTELKASGIEWPEAAAVIPLAFQDGESMASLFKNSDTLITRSGGISSMEAEQTQKFVTARKVYIHSEATPDMPDIFPREHFDACYDTLLKGTVRWEGGNAQYLMKSIDASLTSPDTILFNLKQEKIPSHIFSLLNNAETDLLAKRNRFIIEEDLIKGSNPNMESVGGLPVIAYAEDYDTLKLLIEHGGELTNPVKAYLLQKGIVQEETLHALETYERQAQYEIKKQGYTASSRVAFLDAIQSGKVENLKGLLYRYPKLAFTRTKNITYPEDSKTTAEIKTILQHAQGIPMLSLKLKNQQIPPAAKEHAMLKYLIELNQTTLNQEDSKRKTPLSYCKNAELRKLMVMLGANPSYLAKDINKHERHNLKKTATKSKQNTKKLRHIILKAYLDHRNNQEAFCKAIQIELQNKLYMSHFSDEMAQFTFSELKTAQDEVDLMNIVERMVNLIKYLFGADTLTKRSQSESKKLLFYKESPNLIEPLNQDSIPATRPDPDPGANPNSSVNPD